MRRLVVIGLVAMVLALPAVAAPSTAHAYEHAYTVHVVQPGETLYSIALRYGVTATDVARANDLINPNFIYVGQRLTIPGSHAPSPSTGHPPASGTYTVGLGDTLFSIARRFSTTVSSLVAVNSLPNADFIYVGQVLRVPGGSYPHVPPAPGPGPAPNCGFSYVVHPGDTLSGIAWRHGLTYQALARANGLRYPYLIFTGQHLHIPCAAAPGPSHPKPAKPAPKPAPKPALKPAACVREIQIVRPLVGEHVHGVLQIVGTASIDNFQFYKLEYAQGHNALASAFHSINNVYSAPVWDSVLGTWFVGNMPSGAYTLRLTAVDNSGQFPRPCDVHVYIGD